MPEPRYDVAVIGAGMAGASVAAELADGLKVLLLEREDQPGRHSTGRSAALFSETYGPAPVRALSRASHAFFYDPPEGFAEAPLVKPRDTLMVATVEQLAQLDAFAAEVPDTERLTADAALALCPILRRDRLGGGVLETGSGDMDVHGLHQGYLRRFRSQGGRTVTDADVTGLARHSDGWRIETSAGSFHARVVVNAAGAWAETVGALAGARPIGLEPKRRTAVLVDAPADMSIEAWPMVIDIDEQFYFKPDAGLLLLSPADETPSEPCDAQADEWDVAVAVDRVETATTLQVRRVRHRWAGLRSFVADRVPVAGWDPELEGFFWLAGQGGYGIQTAPALATFAAGLIRGEGLSARLQDFGLTAEMLGVGRLRS